MWYVHFSWKSISAVLAVFSLSCAGRQIAIMDRPLPTVTPPANAATLTKDAETLWAQRSDRQKAQLALDAYKRAFAANPNREVGTKLTQAYYFAGYYVETEPDSQAAYFLRGAETGERVLSLNNDFRMKYLKTKDDRRALDVLEASWAATIYWTAANLEQWTNAQGWRVRYGNKGRVEVYMTRVRELDPNFYFGAVWRYFGVLPTQGRAPFVDIDNAKTQFEKAIAVAADFLANKRLYAETYAVKKKDRALFKKLLDEVAAVNPKQAEKFAPENKYEQERARALLAKIDEYFSKK